MRAGRAGGRAWAGARRLPVVGRQAWRMVREGPGDRGRASTASPPRSTFLAEGASAKMCGVEPLALDPADSLALLGAVDGLRGGRELRRAVAAIEEPVHLVGGAVRGLLTRRLPRELDVAVEGQAAAPIAAPGGPGVAADGGLGTATG